MEIIKGIIIWMIAYSAGFIASIFKGDLFATVLVATIGSAIFHTIYLFWKIKE